MPITMRKQIIFATKWVIKLLKDKYRIISITTISDLLSDAIYIEGPAIDQRKKVEAEATRNRYLTKYFKK